MKELVTIEIPTDFLLHIATYGKLGTGEFSSIMQEWFRRKCNELGLAEELKQRELKRIDELRQNMENVLGATAVERLDKGILLGKRALRIAKELS